MSPRKAVSRARIEELLRAIGSTFRHPCRLYLSGGEGLVWRGLRGVTQDVDVSYEVEPAHHDAWIHTIRELKDRLDLNIEEAQPGDFIPLPPGSADRAEFVGRYGLVDVFLLDPYSVALAKIERGHEHDIGDARSLLAAGVIAPDELRRHFDAILPAYSRRSIDADPEKFRANLELALQSGK